MKKLHKFAAVGVSSVLATFALTPAALAASAASGGAGSKASVPNSNIKGSPAHFSPSSLSAVGRWTKGTPCVSSVVSFTLHNKEAKSETIKVTGTNNLKGFTGTLAAGAKGGVCITTGYHGTVTVKLTSDGKKLQVTF